MAVRRRDFLGLAASLLVGIEGRPMPVAQAQTKNLALKTLDGQSVGIDAAALTELKAGLRGELLAEGAPEYDSVRQIWNAAIDRRPALIVRCATADDIARAVRFAKRHNALLSVRGGGHNAVGFAVADGGLMIDLSPLRDVAVDEARQTARAGGGCTFGAYDAKTHEYGLASTGPIISMVGVGGYTLGGGIGWLHRKLGLACDALVSAEVVTADGEVVTTSETANPDLFWAIRGGGGNFGAGTDEAADRAVKPLRDFGKPLLDLVKARPYPAWQKALDGAWGNGFCNQWVGHYLPEFTDAAAATMLEYVSKVPSPFTDVKLAQMGGAVARVGEDATAFGNRSSKYALVIQSRWKSLEETAANLAWTQQFFDAMKAHSTGKVYVNFVADEGEARIKDAYNPHSLERLRTLKAKYDPDNLFRMNQNIRPTIA